MTHNTRFTGSMTGLPTPREVRIERDLLDLQERVASRPALVDLDHSERRVLALESLAASLEQIAGAHRPAAVEPLAWITVWRTDRTAPWSSDGTIHTDLDLAREEYADACDRYPLLETRLVALVPVVAP